MNTLPIPLLLAVEHCVLVFGQHFSLGRHLLLPRLDALQRLALLGQGGIQCGDDRVDGPQSPALTGFLEFREAPWDLPTHREI